MTSTAYIGPPTASSAARHSVPQPAAGHEDVLLPHLVYLRATDAGTGSSDIPIFITALYLGAMDARASKGRTKAERLRDAFRFARARAADAGISPAIAAVIVIPNRNLSAFGGVSLASIATAASKAGLSTTQFTERPLPCCTFHMYQLHFQSTPLSLRRAIVRATLREANAVDVKTGVEVLYEA